MNTNPRRETRFEASDIVFILVWVVMAIAAAVPDWRNGVDFVIALPKWTNPEAALMGKTIARMSQLFVTLIQVMIFSGRAFDNKKGFSAREIGWLVIFFVVTFLNIFSNYIFIGLGEGVPLQDVPAKMTQIVESFFNRSTGNLFWYGAGVSYQVLLSVLQALGLEFALSRALKVYNEAGGPGFKKLVDGLGGEVATYFPALALNRPQQGAPQAGAQPGAQPEEAQPGAQPGVSPEGTAGMGQPVRARPVMPGGAAPGSNRVPTPTERRGGPRLPGDRH